MTPIKGAGSTFGCLIGGLKYNYVKSYSSDTLKDGLPCLRMLGEKSKFKFEFSLTWHFLFMIFFTNFDNHKILAFLQSFLWQLLEVRVFIQLFPYLN